MPPQNTGDRAAGTFMSQIGYCTMHTAVTPVVILFWHANRQGCEALRGKRSTGYPPRSVVVLCAISLRCHINSVAGFTSVAMSMKSLRPEPFARTAKR